MPFPTAEEARKRAIDIIEKCRKVICTRDDQPALKRHALKLMTIYQIDLDRLNDEDPDVKKLWAPTLSPGLTRRR